MMASPFLHTTPLRHDIFTFLPSPTDLHAFIPLETSSFSRFFFFFFAPFPAFYSAYSSTKVYGGKVLEKFPKREIVQTKCLVSEKKVGNAGSKVSEEAFLSRFTSLSLGMNDGEETLKKNVDLDNEMQKGKKDHRSKLSSDEVEFRIGLDMCSKAGDVLRAISLYDMAIKKGLRLQQYHYNVLLYLCSSAAVGVVYPSKSGSSGNDRCSFGEEESDYDSNLQTLTKQRDFGSMKMPKLQPLERHSKECGAKSFDVKTVEVMEKSTSGVHLLLSDDLRGYARRRGLEIYEKMCLDRVQMSEAAMTSMARIAASMGDGDGAFEAVKQIKGMGITPRLRSYDPAIHALCSNGNLDKAFEVERDMVESGITPEEPELAELLRASVLAGRGDKVYYLLHKLRTIVRQVSPCTADVIDAWFKGSTASKVGKRKWDWKTIKQAEDNNGGGWHGLGWLGKGRWMVARTHVNGEGVCLVCGEKLVNVDLDPVETENFAKSVASMATKRDKNSNFEKFQKWLEYYGPFEAVIDAANVGLFNQRRFSINKVNAVVNCMRQKLPLKKWPLIIVHNKRLLGGKMNEPSNKKLVEKWKNADAIYATPTGSNDDWYWLYAAIKCRCLIVTNDEMRDHVFQVLGNDFFPKWKERHQVRFKHQDGSFQFLMPPPCSVVIQESEKGHWHIPIAEGEHGSSRTWMCVTRASSCMIGTASPSFLKDSFCNIINEITASNEQGSNYSSYRSKHKIKRSPMFTAVNKFSNLQILPAIEAAEKIAGCVIDFQI